MDWLESLLWDPASVAYRMLVCIRNICRRAFGQD